MEVFTLFSVLCAAALELSESNVEAYKQKKYVQKMKYRPLYHISAPIGWLNGPAGFTYFKHKYHIFYQYRPYDGTWKAMRWGQALSDNLVDWVHYPPVILPKDLYDRNGCLAGSTHVHKNYLTIIYTGYTVFNNHSSYTQNIAISPDGIGFQKYMYNPVIKNVPGNTSDIRNPKVWRFRGKWYMLLGGSSTASGEQQGQLLLYTSADMVHWNYNGSILKSYGDMGYLWEIPDVFEQDGQHVLILSVQGIQGDNYRFRNMYQSGYVVGNFNYQSLRFENLEVSLATFMELDFGHDFYAAQTMQALDGRRLLIAWLGMWESDIIESQDRWANMLTVIREVRLNPRGRILTLPIREMADLRSELLEAAWYSPGESFSAGTRSFELLVNSTTASQNAAVIFEWNGVQQYSVEYLAERGRVSVYRSGLDGLRRADWSPAIIHWRIFFDTSSIEVFCGDGEVVFSSRVYPKGEIRVRTGGQMQLHVMQYKLKRSVVYSEKLRQHLRNNFFNNYR